MPDLSLRIDAPEVMDTAPLPAASMRRALAFLALTNRWFGGRRVVLRHLAAWARRWPAGGRAISVLDAGTGFADIPVAFVEWARARGVAVTVTGLDVVAPIAELARARARGFPEIAIVHRDFFDLAATPARYDYVVASLFLHHVEPSATAAALRALDRLARRGLIVSDLRRTPASYGAVRTAALLFGNAVVRHDAPLSVRRAFRVEELEALARDAGLGYLEARAERWFRLSLAGEKPDAW